MIVVWGRAVTLFETPRFGVSQTWVDLSRHGVSFRAAHAHLGVGPRGADGWEMLRPRSNGTGRASTDVRAKLIHPD